MHTGRAENKPERNNQEKLLDVDLIIAAKKVEHYEIASMDLLVLWLSYRKMIRC
jgi:ferritin-like metal-binding protein YciE